MFCRCARRTGRSSNRVEIWPAIDLRGGNASAFGRAITARRPSSATIRPPWPGIGSIWGRSACTWSIWTAPGRAGRSNLAERSRDCRGGRRALRAGRRHPQRGDDSRAAGPGPAAAGDRHAGPARARLVPPDVPEVSRPAGVGDRRPRRPGGHRGLAGDQRRGGDRAGRRFAGEPMAAVDLYRHRHRRHDGRAERGGDGRDAGRGRLAGGGLRRRDDAKTTWPGWRPCRWPAASSAGRCTKER